MKGQRNVFLLLVLAGALVINAIPAFATTEFAKKEKKPCGTCHVSKTPKKGSADLNDVGKCYEKQKSIAGCAQAAKPDAAALVPAQNQRDQTAAVPVTQKSMPSGMPEACKDMVAKHERMMADMKSMDAVLGQKVAAMNAASGPAKTEAMASVINELVSQRMRKEQSIVTMQSDMMEHMGSHMMAGRQRAMNCLMMNTAATSNPVVH